MAKLHEAIGAACVTPPEGMSADDVLDTQATTNSLMYALGAHNTGKVGMHFPSVSACDNSSGLFLE